MRFRTTAFITILALVTGSIVVVVARSVLFRRSPEAKADLTATFLRFEKHRALVSTSRPPVFEELNCAVIKVTNTGNCALSLYGYGWEAPFYYIYSASGLHWSYDHSPGFDWGQMRPIKLGPGRSMQFLVFKPCPRYWMLGVAYCETTADEILPGRAWRALCRLNPPRKPWYIAWTKPVEEPSIVRLVPSPPSPPPPPP